MAALAASRRLLPLLRPELEPCLRSRALNPYSGRARRAGGLRRAPPLVSCRRGFSDEGSAFTAKNNAPDEQFLQLSLEGGEGDDVVPGISESIVKDAKKSAIELLAVRAYSVSELRKKLCGKNYSVDTVDSVIADFKLRGLLNDGFYAESFSRSRWQSSTWGPRRIKQALRQKGVPEAEVDQATRSVFQDDQGDEERVPGRPRRRGPGLTWVLRSFHGSSLCSGIQAVAARGQLAPGEAARAHGEMASVQRFQLGCDQLHYQEAGGTAPSLTLAFCSTLFSL